MKAIRYILLPLFCTLLFIIITLIAAPKDILAKAIATTGGLKDFPTRTVVVLPTYTRENNSDEANYMFQETAKIFKYPYYELQYGEGYSAPSQAFLQLAAEKYNADIAVMPVIDTISYHTYTSFFSRLNGGDEYVQVYLKLSLYSYNRETGLYDRQSATYWDQGDSLDVPSIYRAMDKALEELFQKFPYKRVPTDIPRYGNTVQGIPLATLPAEPNTPVALPPAIQQL